MSAQVLSLGLCVAHTSVNADHYDGAGQDSDMGTSSEGWKKASTMYNQRNSGCLRL